MTRAITFALGLAGCSAGEPACVGELALAGCDEAIYIAHRGCLCQPTRVVVCDDRYFEIAQCALDCDAGAGRCQR